MAGMKHPEKEIRDRGEIDEIIRGCEVCHLAFALENEPYLVPVSFGYDGRYLYIHTAKEGKKIDIAAVNPRICFEMERKVSLVLGESSPCKWTFTYESVIGYGEIEELTQRDDKNHGLSEVVRHYSGKGWDFAPHELDSTRIWRISVDSVTGKRSR